MRHTATTIAIISIALAVPSAARSDPAHPDREITSWPAVQAMMRVAQDTFPGRKPVCVDDRTTPRVWLADIPGPPIGFSTIPGCDIYLEPRLFERSRAEQCHVLVHEYGHTTGLLHSDTGVMAAVYYEPFEPAECYTFDMPRVHDPRSLSGHARARKRLRVPELQHRTSRHG